MRHQVLPGHALDDALVEATWGLRRSHLALHDVDEAVVADAHVQRIRQAHEVHLFWRGGLQGMFQLERHHLVVEGRDCSLLGLEGLYFQPSAKGGAALPWVALKTALKERLRRPRTRLYAFSACSPSSWLWYRGGVHRAWIATDPDLPPFEGAVVDALFASLDSEVWDTETRGMNAGYSVDPSTISDKARAKYPAELAHYERLAPEWEQGRVPLVLADLSVGSCAKTPARILRRKAASTQKVAQGNESVISRG